MSINSDTHEFQYLSYPLSVDTPIYGGQKDLIKFEMTTSISRGDTANSMTVQFPNHVGTHIDFPSHFCFEGKTCSDYPPSFWIFTNVALIESEPKSLLENISKCHKNTDLLLMKTGFGSKRNSQDYIWKQPVLDTGLAKILKDNFPNLRMFGFDMISATSKLDREKGRKVHQEFLCEQDILFVEDMKLDELKIAPKKVIISPLRIERADGAPCTIIAEF